MAILTRNKNRNIIKIRSLLVVSSALLYPLLCVRLSCCLQGLLSSSEVLCYSMWVTGLSHRLLVDCMIYLDLLSKGFALASLRNLLSRVYSELTSILLSSLCSSRTLKPTEFHNQIVIDQLDPEYPSVFDKIMSLSLQCSSEAPLSLSFSFSVYFDLCCLSAFILKYMTSLDLTGQSLSDYEIL